MTELWQLSAAALAELFKSGQASPDEAIKASLDRISRYDDRIGAFACVLAESSISDARDRTAELKRGFVRGPLHGVPVAIKELFDVRGAPADYGSDVLAGRIADADAHLVERLRRGGGVIVGTTRSHEFGWGITTQHEKRRGTRNPWDLDRVPGGSSGGSGAAVAAGMVPVAVGSDTGGSIRIPASFCGVVGLKPTFGRVSRTGGVALAPSFDTPGALGRSVRDVSTLVETIAGSDDSDPETRVLPYPTAPHPRPSLHGVRIAVSSSSAELELDAAVAPVYEQALARFVELGADLVEVGLPDATTIRSAFASLQMAEAYHVHRRVLGLYPGRADDYGADVRSRLESAAEVTMETYLRAQAERLRIRAAFDACLGYCDVIVSPVSAVSPSRVDDSDNAIWGGEKRPLRELVMGFTVPQNMTGLPVCVVPAGIDAVGLPAAVQVTAPSSREDLAAAVAGAFELATGPAPRPAVEKTPLES